MITASRRRPFLTALVALAAAATMAAAMTAPVPAAAAAATKSSPPSNPAVAITAPTADAPAVVNEGSAYSVTFTTNEPGTYALETRPTGTDLYQAVADGAGHGDVQSGSTTVRLTAPASSGSYDLRLRFQDADRKRAHDDEFAALRVVKAPSDKAADVAITAPTSAQPAVVSSGSPLALTFTTDLPGRYAVAYRSAAPGASPDFAAFPSASGAVVDPSRPVTVPLTAPGTPGPYDLRVDFTTAAGIASGAIQPASLVVTIPGVLPSQRCDPIDPARCLLPFPNDYFTVSDPTTATGRRVNLNVLSMPQNVAGKPVDPTEWNRNDGFSPGSMALARVPGLDLHRTWGTESLPVNQQDHLADIARYQEPDAPIVIINTRTGQRHPFWSELDTHPATTDDNRALILRPAVNFEEGTRYIVALRNMRTADGSVIQPSTAFASYRDGTSPSVPDPIFEARRPAMEGIFSTLASAGIGRSDLYLAWDFTVASERNLSERALSIRDKAFGLLGDTNLGDGAITGSAPQFKITTVTDFADGDTSRRIEGTLTVPNFLTPQVVAGPVQIPPPVDEGGSLAAPGSRFNYLGSTDGLPVQNQVQPTLEVPFVCNIPRTATPDAPAHPNLYGHGLLGSKSEANGGSTAAMRQRNFAPCAVDWIGMAFEDLPNVATILTDVSNFPSLADRAQQGFLNFMYLGRALAHPDGLTRDPAFRDAATGRPLVASNEIFYDGNSQGGIMGGALTALSPDVKRAVLGVPGMNYSTLLNRSADWEGSTIPQPGDLPAYSSVFYSSYPDKLDQQLLFGLMQMLWDRAEGDGYAHHMTSNPLPATPAHQVMLQVAFGDHQVANVAAEVEGRTIGAQMHWPALPDGLHWSVDPLFGFAPAQYGTPGGSYLVYWYAADNGNATPPDGNVPDTAGNDPHGLPRKDRAGALQKSTFLLDGDLVDVCSGGPCITSVSTRV